MDPKTAKGSPKNHQQKPHKWWFNADLKRKIFPKWWFNGQFTMFPPCSQQFRPWKWAEVRLPTTNFQVRTASFREGPGSLKIFYKLSPPQKIIGKFVKRKISTPKNGWFPSDSSQRLVLPRPSWWFVSTHLKKWASQIGSLHFPR